MKKLTASNWKTARDNGWYHDKLGLYLQVTSNGAGRSWVYRYNVGGKQRYIGLGPTHTISLATARELARQCREQRLRGVDPLNARNAQRQAAAAEEAKRTTFKQCIDTFLQFKQHEWSNPKHAAQWGMTLQKYAKPLHDISPAGIDLAIVSKALESIWTRIPETASRTRQRIEAVLDHWAAKNQIHDYRNPAAWDRLKHVLPSISKLKGDKHHPALPYERIGEFMRDLRGREGVAARALEFLILCVCRSGDIIGQAREEKPPMLWKHVKWDKRLWEIPSTKTEIAHQIPLSDAALAILQEMKAHGTNDNEPVFPGMNNGESNMTIAKVIKQMNRGGPFWTDPKQDNRPVVPHGFRSSFSDFCGDRTNFDRQTIEFALAHGITDKTEAAYRRTTALEKRRRLMAQWAQYCAKPISNTVISFHRV